MKDFRRVVVLCDAVGIDMKTCTHYKSGDGKCKFSKNIDGSKTCSFENEERVIAESGSAECSDDYVEGFTCKR